eukprot:2575665-Heterocapsa_arctica.AAC.1
MGSIVRRRVGPVSRLTSSRSGLPHVPRRAGGYGTAAARVACGPGSCATRPQRRGGAVPLAALFLLSIWLSLTSNGSHNGFATM